MAENIMGKSYAAFKRTGTKVLKVKDGYSALIQTGKGLAMKRQWVFIADVKAAAMPSLENMSRGDDVSRYYVDLLLEIRNFQMQERAPLA